MQAKITINKLTIYLKMDILIYKKCPQDGDMTHFEGHFFSIIKIGSNV